MKKITILFLSFIIFIVSSNLVYATDTVKIFDDVPTSHYSFKAVHKLRELKITDGVRDNTFGFGENITRSEFITFLVKLMGYSPVETSVASFADNADKTKWYYGYIESALQNEIITKETDNIRPNDFITREEIAVIMIRAAGFDSLAKQLPSNEAPFFDVTANANYITLAKNFGMISGVGEGKFAPANLATREDSAVILMRLYDKLHTPVSELHGFYAISSSSQADFMKYFDTISFGWAKLDYNKDKNLIFINMTNQNNNEYAVPVGFSEPFNLAKKNNKQVLLMVTAGDTYIGDTIISEYILKNETMRKDIISQILVGVNSISRGSEAISFDGVVIDFEYLRGESNKVLFNTFLADLKTELVKSDKKLYTAIHPPRDQGLAYYDGYDFKNIGALSDKVILMAHDYNAKRMTPEEMEMGFTITPLTPIAEVYYAVNNLTENDLIPKDKLILQLSFDSCQWKLRDKKIINDTAFSPSYNLIYDRIKSDVTLNYSNKYGNPYASYFNTEDNTENVIWYEDARSIETKIKLAALMELQGISIWRLGNIPHFSEPANKKVYFNVWDTIYKYSKY